MTAPSLIVAKYDVLLRGEILDEISAVPGTHPEELRALLIVLGYPGAVTVRRQPKDLAREINDLEQTLLRESRPC
jgi:hypothetical protein